MSDEPRGHRINGESMYFETCAVCAGDGHPDLMLGCISWGATWGPPGEDFFDTLHEPTYSSSPSTFWQNTLQKDRPNYAKSNPIPCAL